jgi:pyruvate,orthophosphate dikinase
MAQPRNTPELYLFGCGAGDTSDVTAEAAGNKAANLVRMAGAGLPVPPGFVLPTRMCREYFEDGRRLPAGFSALLAGGVRNLERAARLTFGGDRRPLLVSVRSGAAVSMPGMMDTILNIGLCDRTLPALVRLTGNPRQAWDSYRRLVQAYAEVVQGLPRDPFERLLDECLRREEVPAPTELDVAALRGLTRDFLDEFERGAGQPFPQQPLVQLEGAAESVFRSWQGARAAEFRRLHRLNEHAGTAVTIQTMVFGNMGGTSGSGVAFTRDPGDGADRLYLDFLWNAQGEDVVSGRYPVQEPGSLGQTQPGLYDELRHVARRLEGLFGDVQDFEFTVQEGRLYLLQARDAKRTPWAALRIACDLVREGLIDEKTALARLTAYDLHSIQRVRLAAADGCRPLARGVPASPGVATGAVVFDPAAVVGLAAEGTPAILVRADISTDDIAGLSAAAGVLTARGGRTSHAAVVARQLNKVCVVGCRELALATHRRCHIGGQAIGEGDLLSLDGHSGDVYAGPVQAVTEQPTDYLAEVERWKSVVS